MDGRRLKFVVLVVGIVATMGGLLIVGMNRPGGFAYYVTVGEFLAAPGQSGVRINGKVAPGSIERLPSGQDVRFRITDADESQSLAVRYHGIIPDTFVDDADVVVEGELDAQGTFAAHTLLAKCPSKYEAAADEATAQSPASGLPTAPGAR